MQGKRKLSLSAIQENWIVALLIAFGVGVTVLDFSGLLDGLPLIRDRVPIITLLLLTILTGYVAVTKPGTQESMYAKLLKRTAQINEKIETIDSLKEIRVRPFNDFTEALAYTNRKIKHAKFKVNSVYWDAELNFDQVLAKSINHRELFIIDETNRQHYTQNLPSRITKGGRNYSCAYFRTTKDTALQFVIIDAKEVIFLSNFPTHNVSIRHPNIVGLFVHHYDEMWQKAIKLKQYDRLHKDRLGIALARPVEPIPADLEKCVQRCLAKHQELKIRPILT